MYRLACALLFLLLASVLPAQAATYYVSTGGSGTACTEGSPCGSFATAIGKLTPGDTLYIRGGNYNQSISSNAFFIPSGTSWSNPITIAGYPGEIVTLFPGGNGILNLVAGASCGSGGEIKYLIFERLIFDSNGGTIQNNACGDGVHHIRFQDVEMRNDVGQCFAATDSNALFDSEFIRVHIHHCGLGFKEHGIYMCGKRTVIRDSEFDHCSGFGIHIYDSTYHDCGDGIQILNNNIHDNWFGITINWAPNTLIANNIIYNHTLEGGWGVQVDRSSDNTHVYNNTFHNVPYGVQPQSGRVSGVIIKNNIFSQVGGVVVDEAAAGTVTGNNLCTSSGTGCTLTGNPMFTNPGNIDFSLQSGSDARNAGQTLSEVTTDRGGRARPQGPAYDIGAYEFAEGGGTVPPTGNPIYLSAGGHGDTPTDSGDCTVPENWMTPRATLAGAATCMTVPGKTLFIRGGTYVGTLDTGGGIPIAGGSTPATPTRIEGYQDEAVIIQLPAGPAVGLYLRAVSNLTVAKVTIDAMARAGSNAVACINGSNLVLRESTFRNSFYEAGYFADCTNVTIFQSTFHTSQTAAVVGLDGTIAALTMDEGVLHTAPLQGIRANVTNGSNTSLVITRMQIHGTGLAGATGGHAIDLGPGSGALVVNNIIDHNNAGVRLRSGASGAKVYHNALASNAGTALQCDAGAGVPTPVTISNNISFGNAANGVVNNCAAMLATNLDNGTDPLWVSVAGRDFHPGPTSPAIDAGTTLPEVMAAIDCTPRPVGLIYDQGPYEMTKSVVPSDPPPPPGRLISRYLGMLY